MLYKRIYINRVYGQRQTIDYDGSGVKRSVSYSQTTAAIVGGSVPSDDRYTVTSTRTYVGPHIFTDGALEYSSFEGGYIDPAKGVMYYITDWQGNNAAVIDKSGDIVQSTTYYPYGEPTIEPRGQRFLFGGKEREHAAGRNSYDFGARNLAANAWTTPDPLAEKFYPLSPYSYCGGDPINNIDPTGKIIEFADSSNVEFIHAFNEAVSYLREYGASKWVDNIINSKKVYTLVAEPKHNYIEESKAGYSRVTIGSNGDIKRELIWDYSIVIETETDYFISPAETLSHEADHLYRSEIDFEGQQKDNSTYDEQYGNLEDRRVIQGSEQIVAHKLKRLPAGQSTRFSHGMRLKHKAKDVRGGYIDNPGLIVTSKKQKK